MSTEKEKMELIDTLVKKVFDPKGDPSIARETARSMASEISKNVRLRKKCKRHVVRVTWPSIFCMLTSWRCMNCRRTFKERPKGALPFGGRR